MWRICLATQEKPSPRSSPKPVNWVSWFPSFPSLFPGFEVTNRLNGSWFSVFIDALRIVIQEISSQNLHVKEFYGTHWFDKEEWSKWYLLPECVCLCVNCVEFLSDMLWFSWSDGVWASLGSASMSRFTSWETTFLLFLLSLKSNDFKESHAGKHRWAVRDRNRWVTKRLLHINGTICWSSCWSSCSSARHPVARPLSSCRKVVSYVLCRITLATTGRPSSWCL